MADLETLVKPRLRGWIHTAAVPLALIGGVLLIALAPTAVGRTGGAIYLAASLALFGVSAVYHRGNWGARTKAVLRRMDHANIFVFIAATYTPLALTLLSGASRVTLLVIVWASAVLGLAFRVLWLSAPRWLYVLLYISMGWAAFGWMDQFWASGGPVVTLLIFGGGLIYTLGALVYARRWPDPSPAWFGFHEIFHTCTLLAAGAHYAAISLATYGA